MRARRGLSSLEPTDRQGSAHMATSSPAGSVAACRRTRAMNDSEIDTSGSLFLDEFRRRSRGGESRKRSRPERRRWWHVAVLESISEVVTSLEHDYPSAAACLAEDLPASCVHLDKFPPAEAVPVFF